MNHFPDKAKPCALTRQKSQLRTSQVPETSPLPLQTEDTRQRKQKNLEGPRCPVCSTLPLENLPRGIGAPALQYVVDLDSPQQQEMLQEWYSKCNLVRLVYNLSKYWSGESDGCQLLEQTGDSYNWTCNNWLKGLVVKYGENLNVEFGRHVPSLLKFCAPLANILCFSGR